MLIGYFYNNIMPARAGEAARVVVLTQRSSAPAVETTSTVVLERIYDVVAILLIFFVAEPWLPSVSWVGTAAVVAGCLAVAIAATAAVLVIFEDRPLRALLRPLRRHSRFSGERLEHAVRGAGARAQRAAQPACRRRGPGVDRPCMAVDPLHLVRDPRVPPPRPVLGRHTGQVSDRLAIMLPSPPAAVGVFEGAVLIALRAYGVPRSEALPFGIVLHLVNFVPFVVAGAWLLHY